MARKSSISVLSPATASTRSGATTTLPSMPSGDVVMNAGPSTHADTTPSADTAHMRHSYFVLGARPVAAYGLSESPGTTVHASVPTAWYDSVKESPSAGTSGHESVAVVSPTSVTFKPSGTTTGCTRTHASLLLTGSEPAYVTWQRTKPLAASAGSVRLLPVSFSITVHAWGSLGSESSARFSHTYASSSGSTMPMPSRFVVAVSEACPSGATAWSLGSTSTDSSFRAGCSEAVTNRFANDGSDSTPFCTACTRHS